MASDGDAGCRRMQQVYLRLRDMVLYGDLAPGQAVTIQGLTDAAGRRHDPGARGDPPADRRRRAGVSGQPPGQRAAADAPPTSDEIIVARECAGARPDPPRRCSDATAPTSRRWPQIDAALDRGDRAGRSARLSAAQPSVSTSTSTALADAPILARSGRGLVAALRPVAAGGLRPVRHAEPARQHKRSAERAAAPAIGCCRRRHRRRRARRAWISCAHRCDGRRWAARFD